jgi:hypothetical protein
LSDADTEGPIYEEALALLAAARQRPQGLSGLLSVLTHPEEALLPAATSPVAWLVSWYRSATPELREAFVGGVLGLLRDPGTDAGTLARTLAFVEAAELQEAVHVIRSLVDTRRLTGIAGEYSDLHGRALRAMFVLDALDPVQCLERELPHGKYVPLAFAFVREKAKEQVPLALSSIARFPFFPEALRTVLLTYPIDGLRLLAAAARYARMEARPDKIQAFQAALPYLPILSRDREDLAMILENAPAAPSTRPTPPLQASWSAAGRTATIAARSPKLNLGTLAALQQFGYGVH